MRNWTLTMLFQRERAISVWAFWLRWKQSGLKKVRSGRPSCGGERTRANTKREMWSSDLQAASATDLVPGHDDVPQKRLDDHREVWASVVAARLHQLMHRMLSQGEKRREAKHKSPQVFIIRYRRPTGKSSVRVCNLTWYSLLSLLSMWSAWEFSLGKMTQGHTTLCGGDDHDDDNDKRWHVKRRWGRQWKLMF